MTRVFDSYGVDEISKTIAGAIKSAAQHRDQTTFEFNGVTVIVAGDSDPKLIYRDWNRGLSGYLGDDPHVGPYPWLKLSAEALASDAAIQAEKDRKQQIRQAEYDKQQASKANTLQEALGKAGPLELSDAETWNKCVESNRRDPCSARVVRYAEEWGRLMQTRIANGESIAQCAHELSRLAYDDGITGFMYGCAVQMLVRCWKHGEELRLWRNCDTQIGTDGDKANEIGGVLNLAVLSIGG